MSVLPRFVLLHLEEESAPATEGKPLKRAVEAAGGSYLRVDGPGRRQIERLASGLPAVLAGPEEVLTGPALDLPSASVVLLSNGRGSAAALRAIEDRVAGVLGEPLDEEAARDVISRAGRLAALLAEVVELRERAESQGRELRELNRIGVALTSERDPEALLTLILTKCREITCADAGSLYLVEKKPGASPDEENYFADKILLFRLAQNDSVRVSFKATPIEISGRSLAGYVALTGERLTIEDAYEIPADREYSFNRSFDEASHYRTKSLLVIPMMNPHGEVLGVLQLINRKRDRSRPLDSPEAASAEAIAFDERAAELASSLASQAAVAIENARLYKEIENLFEGFIRASVTAIESRDPTTSGHSERVATLTVGLARRVDGLASGPYAGVRFTRDEIKQIQYASLLHDFGKIGVRENVLLKGKKLFDHELDRIRARFAMIRRGLELKFAREKLRLFDRSPREDAAAAAAALDAEMAKRLAELDLYLDTVVAANEPTVLKEEGSALLKIVGGAQVEDVDGGIVSLLEPWEISNLSIKKGSLSEKERREIESHVTHTFHFLETIPWTRELRQIPQIAGSHHEKLDGSGYPLRIKVDRIPIESKMMTISDIFDALTANDRPYKKAMPTEKALDILTYEVREGKVDPDLFEIFVESRVFESVLAGTGGSRA